MYSFGDYFDTKKKKKPYGDPSEDFRDHLQALDMLIESYMFFKAGKQDEGSFRARGVKVSVEEIASYIAEPPLERPQELRAVNIANDVGKALEHIRSREDESIKQGMTMPVRNIIEEFSLDIAELFIILMAAALRCDLKYLRMFDFIADTDAGASLNAGIADALLNFILPLPGTKLEECLSPSGKLCTFLLMCDDTKEASKLMQHIRLNDAAYYYMLGGGENSVPEVNEKELFFRGFTKEAAASAKVDEGVHLRYVESSDKEDVEYALGNAAALIGCPFYSVRALELYEAEMSVRQ